MGAGRRWSGQSDAHPDHDKENSPSSTLPSNAAVHGNPLLPPQAPDSDDMPDLKTSARSKRSLSLKGTSLPKPAPGGSLRSSRSNNFKSADYVSGH